ncbi:hypothetical protein Q7P37_006644 [Cladosporium fusiforme]
MPSTPSPKDTASKLLAEKGLDLLSLTLLQSLWAGYGQICRISASPKGQSAHDSQPHSIGSTPKDSVVSTPKETHSYILKLITPPLTRAGDEGHARKILSYQIEQYFYSNLAPKLPSSIPVAKCLASINEQHKDRTSTTAMILSDLAQEYPVAGEKRAALSSTQALSALDWLSNFHGFWWSRTDQFDRNALVLPPLEQIKHSGENASANSVWLSGGYTYLATRRKEYADLVSDDDTEWNSALTQPVEGSDQSIAEVVAAFLTPAVSGPSPIESYQTLIHGDVKSENLFTSASGQEVAFYDFQYVGLGLGVCDLAKFFTCSVPLEMLVEDEYVPDVLTMQEGERVLLERYWKGLRHVGEREYEWDVFVRHWEVALVDWLRFQASWGFWGNTEWLEARVRSILTDGRWIERLVGELKGVGGKKK